MGNLCYFVFIYKKDAFYAGMGDIPTNTYTKQSKKTWIFTMLGETVVLLVAHSYFLCVVTAYADVMHGPPKDEVKEDEPEKEEKPDEASQPKKEDQPAEDGAADAAGEGN